MSSYDRWRHASDEADAKVKSLKGKIRRRKKKLANIIAEYLRMEISLMAFGVPPENFSRERGQLQLEDHREADR